MNVTAASIPSTLGGGEGGCQTDGLNDLLQSMSANCVYAEEMGTSF